MKNDLANDAGYGPFTFNDLNNAVDAREGDFFAQATGPEDFEFIHFGGGAEAEMEPWIRGRGITCTAEDVGALADAACGEERFRADGVAGSPSPNFRG